ncbi:MAG: hypothetical protein AABW87_00705 [Nanoarchaeota archaeon]
MVQYFSTPSSSSYELTKSDIFSISNFNAKQVSVFGVRLGDTQEIIFKKLGKADKEEFYDPDISNWEYSKAIDLQFAGLVFQFKSGILTRITIKQPFNKFLKGETKIDHTKEEIYAMFGNPDSSRYVQYSSSTGRAYRLMNYMSRNMEIILLGEDQNGFSFYL